MSTLDPELRAAYEAIQGQLNELKETQAKKGKLLESRRALGAQKNENELVRSELNHLEPDAAVYKLIGPALVQQSEQDAKSIVEKRLEYITNEIARVEAQAEEFDKKEEAIRHVIVGLQERMNKRGQFLQQQAQQAQAQQA